MKNNNKLILTHAQFKLLNAADEIWNNPATEKEATYIARQLMQATLPHSDPGNVPVWTRKNGNLTLAIQPGVNIETKKSYGYPYGTIPRLLLFWMTTEALRTKSRHLELGNSLSAFMAELGLNPDNGSLGAKRSDARRLKDQMERLFNAFISFQGDFQHETRIGTARHNMLVARKTVLWWNLSNPDQQALWGSWVELGKDFYKAIISTPVPVDIRALKALKNSPLALDLYSWLTYEAYRAHKKSQSRFISWKLLHNQFGAEYAEVRNFQQKARGALTKVKQIYPSLQLGRKRGGIEILPQSFPALRAWN